ncbi:MAG TPA: DUF3159 domain-containing protein [Dietzia timorensis]|uniref:DUF3159 domain-containing protein n=1 Tax=Dietzia timorensis TaxID=499555 RepID=A0A921F371_9ACTN|nr:DUF3159 domain-containing protein [Dietzia timorensis]HJE90941.1 DUF3159 domain-containing protein [Dietzia timorensis]
MSEKPTEKLSGSASSGAGAKPAAPSMFGDPDAPLLEQMGGVKGLVTSTLPVLAFVPVNAFWGLRPAMFAAIGAAVVLLLWTVIRREKIAPAIGGFFAVVICVFIAYRTGSARGYYLYGIITQIVYGLVFAVSAAVKWPLVGVIWGFVNGHGNAWRKVPAAMRWYIVATAIWAFVFFARVAVQAPLYYADLEDALGVARIAMGWPLAIVAAAGTVWAVKKANDGEEAWYSKHPEDRPLIKRDETDAEAPETAEDESPRS